MSDRRLCDHGHRSGACPVCDRGDMGAIVRAFTKPDPRDARIAELSRALEDAATEIADWGAYASEYLRQKHGLDETVRAFRAIARDVGIDEVDALIAEPGAG